MSYEVDGILHKVFDTENKTQTFQAREFVIKTEGQYTQYIKFQLTQDRCAAIDGHNEGDAIKVFFDLRGREWNEKYFTNLNAWKIEKAGGSTVESTADTSSFPAEEPPFNKTADDSNDFLAEDMGDLPF